MIKYPPSDLPNPWADITPEQLIPYVPYCAPVDSKGRYWPYDEFRHRISKELIVDTAWFFTKQARSVVKETLLIPGSSIHRSTYVTTNLIRKATTVVDQGTTTAALEWSSRQFGEEEHLKYLLLDLVEDEAISSSQLEGAATTTLVAKELLKRKREPRNIDEKMILGNFRMMRFVWDKRESILTPELIQELHAIGVSGIDDKKYIPGVFRSSNDVVVEDREGNIVHQPPLAEGLEKRFEALCKWVNTDHDDIESIHYIHPLVKAICIHFTIGYEHPFRDGNGRVARALFYWIMFKKDYGAFRYISISNLLKDAATQYGKSYLYTETDEMDMTYFIDYQCSVIMRAVAAFKSHCQKTVDNIESFNKWLFNSGIYGKLSEKQKVVFQVAKSSPNTIFTARYIEEKLNCSYNTAANVLNGLVDLNLFDKQKDGKEWIYSLRDKQEIQKNWIA